MSGKRWWALAVAACLALGARCALRSEEGTGEGKKKEEKKGARKVESKLGSRQGTLPTVDALAAELGPDLALTADQKAQMLDLRTQLLKQGAELADKTAVKAAQAEVEKARAGGDPDELKVAQTKLRELLGGFSLKDEFRRGLSGILTPRQFEKLYPAKTTPEKGTKSWKREEGKKRG